MFDSGHTDTAARRKELLRRSAGSRRRRARGTSFQLLLDRRK
jgi:hypothetical protein